MKALLAQDEDESTEAIKLAFSVCLPECELEMTNSSKRALEIISSNEAPDICIIDSNLPDCDASNLIKKIRTISEVPLIVISYIDSESEIVKALELGADEYITKPFRQLEFMAHVRSLIKKRMEIKTKAKWGESNEVIR